MKILYFTMEYFDEENAQTSGVVKKIKGQMAAMSTLGAKVEYIARMDNGVYLFAEDKRYKLCDSSGTAFFDFKEVANGLYPYIEKKRWDGIYVRYCGTNCYVLKIYKRCVQQGIKVILEFPTYPFKKEMTQSIRGTLIYMITRMFNSKISKYVYKAVAYNNVDTIYGIPTIRISNGIALEGIPVTTYNHKKNINLIAIGTLEYWQGYDRLLRGLGQYYEKENETRRGIGRIVKIDIVGDGPETEKYREIVLENSLQPYVRFHGRVGGESLEQIFKNASIGVNSIGCHRKGLRDVSTLKSREFLARGLPVVFSTEDSAITGIEEFAHFVSENDEPIDIEKLIIFYDELAKNEDVSGKIRKYAETSITWKAQMEKIYREFV